MEIAGNRALATAPPQDDESESTHSMVIVAVRIDQKTNTTFLLLQNSWSRMPLVEVSLDYLVASEANLCFVGTKDHELFQKLADKDCFYGVNKAFVADCSHGMYSSPAW